MNPPTLAASATGVAATDVANHLSPVPYSTCRFWTSSRNTRGAAHGNITGRRVEVIARAVWERANGPIPEGMYVLHNCHNGHEGCIELSHLRLGTLKENTQDIANLITVGRLMYNMGVSTATLNNVVITVTWKDTA